MNRKTARRVQFKGIVKFAKLTNTSREHVYRVLIGERVSARITHAWARYQAGSLRGNAMPGLNQRQLRNSALDLLDALEAMLAEPFQSQATLDKARAAVARARRGQG